MTLFLRDLPQKTKPLLAAALNMLFPPRCPACREATQEAGALCSACWPRIHFLAAPLCECCGHPFDFAVEGMAFCAACLAKKPPFVKARAVFRYDDESRPLVLGLKYQDRTHLAPVFGRWLARAGAAMLPHCDAIIPIPLHARRLLFRRFNQSALLARALGRLSGLPVWPDGLLRRRHTQPQAGLSRRKRQVNVRGAFRVNPRRRKDLTGLTILLIDDVLTTGATIAEAAKILRRGGAAAVYVLTLARRV